MHTFILYVGLGNARIICSFLCLHFPPFHPSVSFSLPPIPSTSLSFYQYLSLIPPSPFSTLCVSPSHSLFIPLPISNSLAMSVSHPLPLPLSLPLPPSFCLQALPPSHPVRISSLSSPLAMHRLHCSSFFATPWATRWDQTCANSLWLDTPNRSFKQCKEYDSWHPQTRTHSQTATLEAKTSLLFSFASAVPPFPVPLLHPFISSSFTPYDSPPIPSPLHPPVRPPLLPCPLPLPLSVHQASRPRC